MLERFDEVMAIMLPSLREERAQTYSPFLPIDPTHRHRAAGAGRLAHDAKAGTITYEDPDTKERVTTPVTGGRCKLQWKPDWAMRWVALGVDYEMAGKDLIDSVKLSGEICRALGGTPPEGFNYELFLDEKGQKISKSKGNGLTIDEWLRYASPGKPVAVHVSRAEGGEAAVFRRDPAQRRRLSAVPRRLSSARTASSGSAIRSGTSIPAIRRKADMPISFSMLLTLVSSSNAENAETLWGFIGRYRPGVTPQTHPKLDALVGYAIHYFRDFVLPAKKFREPTEGERKALTDLRDALSQLAAGRDRRSKSRTWSTRSAAASRSSITRRRPRTASPACRSTGSTCSTRCCSGRRKARASARSSRSTASKNTVDMIDGALARSAERTAAALGERLAPCR